MVEVFDACGVSFVAVTQQFNTTTSMGRLALNVLLSFAQFEREVTVSGSGTRSPPPNSLSRSLTDLRAY
jgi:DNA invertase Pin-like site-specific DNA recombinase